jgi:hypothetical protein
MSIISMAKYQSSVVYEFTCPGCESRYIGKTDRCFYTRIKERSLNKNLKFLTTSHHANTFSISNLF